MISLGGFLYGLGTDILEASRFSEEDKLVDREFLEKSGLQEKYEKAGYFLRRVVPNKIKTRLLWTLLLRRKHLIQIMCKVV